MNEHYPLNLFSNQLIEEDIDSLTGEQFLRASAQFVLKFLWQSWEEESWPDTIFDQAFFDKLKNKDHSLPALFKALLKQRDPYLLKAIRLETQQILLNAFHTLNQTPPQNDSQHLKAKLAIHNMLSIYVMFSPTPYETLQIPQNIDDKWQLVTFKIDPIELTPNAGWWVNFLGDRDRLFSYGFSPSDNTRAQSILAHCGTGWPTAQGSTIQIIADIWPDKTPGEVFFEWQSSNINKWLDSQEGRVNVTGQSLGGSLAYLTALHRPDKIDQAYCLVPPGMSENYKSDHHLFGAWDEMPIDERPNVYIQKQYCDPVSKCGEFKEDFLLVKTQLEQEPSSHKVIRLFAAHACNYTAHDKSTIGFGDMKEENESEARKANNYYLYNKARPVVFYGLLMPYFFLIKPFRPWLERNAFTIMLTSMLLLTCLFIPPVAGFIASLPLISTIANPIFAVLAGSYALSYISNSMFEIFNLASYTNKLSQLSFAKATIQIIYDSLNLLTLGLLKTSITIIKLVSYDLPNFFTKQQPAEASIHTEQFNQQTENLDNHPSPNIYDKLQVLSLVILFYVIAWPIKTIFYDLPNFVMQTFKTFFSAANDNSEYELNSKLDKAKSPADNWDNDLELGLKKSPVKDESTHDKIHIDTTTLPPSSPTNNDLVSSDLEYRFKL